MATNHNQKLWKTKLMNTLIGTTKIIATAAELDKAIASIKSRGAKLDKDIHRAAVSCLAHFEAHGDCTQAFSLMGAMPKSSRGKALNDWFAAHCPIDLASKCKDKKPSAKKFQVTEAELTPFWDFKAEKEVVQYNIAKVVTTLGKGIERGVAQGNIKPSLAKALSEAIEAVLNAEKTTKTKLKAA